MAVVCRPDRAWSMTDFVPQLDKLVTTLLDRQVRQPRFVDLVRTWDRYVPPVANESPEALVGAYWDPVWFAVSTPERVRSVDTVNVCQYLDLVSYAYHEPTSAYYRDPAARKSAIAAMDFCARRVNNGRPLTNACFDFGLIALAEAMVRLKDDLPEAVSSHVRRAIRDAAGDLLGLYEASDRPPGTHNHQAVTGHAMLQAGIALEDRELKKRGCAVLTENLGYFDEEGCGYEHDRKYEAIVMGTLVRSFELTGDPLYLQVARWSARYNMQFVSPGGEYVELTSRRPDCAGDFTMAYALYAYRFLGLAAQQHPAPEGDAGRDRTDDDCFAAIALRLDQFIRSRQRDDGLWQGFLYAMDRELHFDKMDPYYMTGYGLPPLLWSNALPSTERPAQLPDVSVLTKTERSVSHRHGDFHLCAGGHDRRQTILVGSKPMASGPEDLFVIDTPGPGVWGFACHVLCADGKWRGDLGGFTPYLRLDPRRWKAERYCEGWVIHQALEVLDEARRPIAELECELTVSGALAVLRVVGRGDKVTRWLVGPNVRAVLGELCFASEGRSQECRHTTERVPVGEQVELAANGRKLTVTTGADGPHRRFLTPRQDNNHSLRHRLVTGDVVGLRLEVEGDAFAAVWRVDGRE